MNWFTIRIQDKSDKTRGMIGCSPDSIEVLAKRAARGDYIRLDDMLYWDRGEYKSLTQWDAASIPTIYINPTTIISIMQFKADPRTIAK